MNRRRRTTTTTASAPAARGPAAPQRRRAIDVTIDAGDALVVVKTGRDDAGVRAVEREALILGQIRHPNVVELVRTERRGADASLVTAFAGRSTLATASPPDAEAVARHGLVLLTILRELHVMGWAHGRVVADHCVLGPGGRMTLCGLGAAHRVGSGSPRCDADLAGAAAIVADLAAGVPVPRTRRDRARLDRLRRAVASPDQVTASNVAAVRDELAAIVGDERARRRPAPRERRSRRGADRVERSTLDATTRASPRSNGSNPSSHPGRTRPPKRWTAAAATTATLLAFFAIVVVLRWLGGPLADPLSVDGVRRVSGVPRPIALALGVVRIGAFAACLYGIALSTATLAAIATQRRDLRRLATRLAPPRFRSALIALIALGVVASAAGPTSSPGARTTTEVHHRPPAPPRSVATTPSAAPRVSSTRSAQSGPDVSTEPGVGRDHGTRPSDAALPDLWVMGPGDHLWSVAEAALSAHLGRPALDAEIDPYWRAVIELNRESLIDPHTPDLVFVGQVIELPPLG